MGLKRPETVVGGEENFLMLILHEFELPKSTNEFVSFCLIVIQLSRLFRCFKVFKE